MGTLSNIITIIAISFGIAILLFMAYLFIKKKYMQRDPFEDMEGEEFEKYCAQLLERRGFSEIEMTSASHDYGVDILGIFHGISYAIQCKCYSETVGIKAVQEAYAGRDYYDCMVAVVMTNQSFTRNAEHFADKLHVLLWDGEYIEKLIAKYGEASDYGEIKGKHEIRKYARRAKKKLLGQEAFDYESLDDISENSMPEGEKIEETVIVDYMEADDEI